ncbi:MAG: PilZ domain-containing protein [Candidatus Omnitrophica bacterium]|nr:PilZ domain-containing protein [Candidatus Omnitrophota bacterium]MBU1925838.1 PilZ domain-containing protein [Candidatus Omnitrophota bacterium]
MSKDKSSTRLPLSCEANYKILGDFAPPKTVSVTEISESGFKFITTQEIPRDRALEVAIKVTETSHPLMATGKVLWQKNISSKYLLDTCVEFIRITPQHKSRLISYINNFAEHIKFKRDAVRCSMMTEVRYTVLDGTNKTMTCLSGDVGIKGLKLHAEEQIDVNTNVQVVFGLPGEKGFIQAKGRIVWKQEEQGRILAIGVEFADIKNEDKERILQFINSRLSITKSA